MQRAPQGGSLWKASCWISNSMYVSFKSDFGYFGYVGYVMIFHDISIKINHSIDLTSTVSDFQDYVFFL